MNKVYLVGAGPGDPELITLKGRRVMASADVVLYDNLANRALLDLAPGAEHIYVGKKRAHHVLPQSEITALMIRHAREGKNVVRLKGGDPLMFGRGGEELEGLVEAGILYEVVPGVTAPLGIAAYTGVPLTYREQTSVVTFVSGHSIDRVNWAAKSESETLVIFMGMHDLPEIVERLLAAGRSADTPAMVVRWGTRPDQKTVSGALKDLPALVQSAGILPPATVIIGEVVRLREKLGWFEQLPLFGQTIIVTRSRAQAGEFSAKLRELGACVLEIPVIELAPLEEYSVLDAAIGRLESYDWLIFTSTNAVEYFFARVDACRRDVRAIRGRVCAIGPATATALRTAGIRPDLVPEEHVSEGVAAAFAFYGMQGKTVLIPRAAAAREVIPEALTHMGARVEVADAYRNVIPAGAEQQARDARADWITFTSGSTVKNWLAVAGAESLAGVKVASIGPATSEVARRHGLRIDVEASPSTTDALIDAIVRACRGN